MIEAKHRLTPLDIREYSPTSLDGEDISSGATAPALSQDLRW
jgi:hypothetical protein